MNLYVDDNTGRYYMWDGSRFVPYGEKPDKPVDIGNRGDEDITAAEEEKRQQEIEKEQEENPDDDEMGDDVRMQEIQRRMSDEKTSDKLDYDRITVSQKEKRRQKEIARKNTSGYGMSGNIDNFKLDFSKFIKSEVADVEMSTWSRRNRRYTDTPFIMQGSRMEPNPHIPSVRVYFDHSSSWGADKIAVGKRVINTIVQDYVKKGKLVVEILYFGTQVSENPNETGGSTNGKPIMENISRYKPDNVIIMTDSDIDDLKATTVVPGGVFLLFKGGVSHNLQDHIKGKKVTRSYEL